MKWNESYSTKLKRLMALKVHRDGFKAANSLEWQSAGMIVVVCLYYRNFWCLFRTMSM